MKTTLLSLFTAAVLVGCSGADNAFSVAASSAGDELDLKAAESAIDWGGGGSQTPPADPTPETTPSPVPTATPERIAVNAQDISGNTQNFNGQIGATRESFAAALNGQCITKSGKAGARAQRLFLSGQIPGSSDLFARASAQCAAGDVGEPANDAVAACSVMNFGAANGLVDAMNAAHTLLQGKGKIVSARLDGPNQARITICQ